MKIPATMPFVQEITANKFWVIGDVHGMYEQFSDLLEKIYEYEKGGDYTIVSVGDICDRGDQSYRTFMYFMMLRLAGRFYNVMGNHDEKLLRALTGSKVQPKHGLNITLEELHKCASANELEFMIGFLQNTPLTIKMITPNHNGVVVHAGFHHNFYGHSNTPWTWGKPRTAEYAIYGPVHSVSPDGKPDRIAWEDDYAGTYAFYGHKIIGTTPKFSTHACGVDTGCFENGILSAVSFPDKVVLQVTGKHSSIVVA